MTAAASRAALMTIQPIGETRRSEVESHVGDPCRVMWAGVGTLGELRAQASENEPQADQHFLATTSARRNTLRLSTYIDHRMAGILRRSSRLLYAQPQRGFRTSAVYNAAQNFTMPAMSPTMTEGNIASWRVKEGESGVRTDLGC